jgi:hypothetical protein
MTSPHRNTSHNVLPCQGPQYILFWESFTIYNLKTNILKFDNILNNGAIVLDSFFQVFDKETSIFQKKQQFQI